MVLTVGQSADRSEDFCSIVPFSQLPTQVPKSIADLLNNSFFQDKAFWRNKWTIFYIWPPHGSFHKRPLLLITLQEAINFIDSINENIKKMNAVKQNNWCQPLVDIGILQTKSLILSFDFKHSSLRPRFLGVSDSPESFTSFERTVPKSNWRPEGELPESSQPPQVCLEAMRLKVEKQLDRQKAPKQPKQFRTAKAQWKLGKASSDLIKLERYLGLRPKAIEHAVPKSESGDSWTAYQETEAERLRSLYIPPPNLQDIPQYPLESEVVFVCIDIESYERAPRMITEVGVSILDTKDLVGKVPGIRGQNWYASIRSHHFRIMENAHLVNELFVHGDPTGFRHGRSEMIHLKDAPAVIASCFKAPFHPAQFSTGGNDMSNSEPSTADNVTTNERRHVILVGHDVQQDIRYLHWVGYDVYNLSSLEYGHATMDTQALFRALNRHNATEYSQPASLGRVLRALDIEAIGLHNAGNDAALTLQALIAMVMKHATERDCDEDELAHRLDDLLGTKTAKGPPRKHNHDQSLEGKW